MSDANDRLNLLLSLNRYADAEREAREALGRDPDWANGYTHLARALAGLGRLADAELAARTGVGKDPQDAWAHAVHAWVLNRLGRWADARSAVREALRLWPGYPFACGELAFLLWRLN